MNIDAPCKFCGAEPNRIDDEFCSDECAAQWAEQLFFAQPEEAQARLRPRVVLLKVIQSSDEVAEDLSILDANPRPQTRGECLNDGPNAQRPCPYVSCSMHLYLDVLENGAVRYNFPGAEVEDLEETCALDVADADGDGITLEQIGKHMNVTRERVRQLIEQALKAGKAATNVMYKNAIDVEDVTSLPDLRHALEDIIE